MKDDLYRAKRQRCEATDEDIGMLLTVLNTTGVEFERFTASTKDLYSDFIVREIPKSNEGGVPVEPLVLTKVGDWKTPPASELNAAAASAEAADAVDPTADPAVLKDEILSVFTALCGASDATAIVTDLHIGNGDTVVLSPIESKENRTKVHQEVKRLLGDRYVSTTDNGNLTILKADATIRRAHTRRKNAGDKKVEQAENGGTYLHFTVYKENTDSAAALRFIAKTININQKSLMFCGTKDKRAVTLQRVACKGLDPERLKRLNRMAISRNGIVRVGDFARGEKGLSLGDLGGNHFTIALRLVKPEDCTRIRAHEAAWKASHSAGTYLDSVLGESLRTRGFVNYFGPQRFGTTSILTSDVGRELLSGNMRNAILLILASRVEICPEAADMVLALLSPSTSESDAGLARMVNESSNSVTTTAEPPCQKAPRVEGDASTAVEAVKKDDAPSVEKALNCCPHYCFTERDLLRYLVHNPDDWSGAFASLPRHSGMLYFHAVQSLLWNRWASIRVAASPDKVMAGDLVQVLKTSSSSASEASKETPQAAGGDDDVGFQPSGNTEVRIVTEADIQKGLFTIHDVVMTMPGCDQTVMYPNITSIKNGALSAMTREVLQGDVEAQLGSRDLLNPDSILAKQFHFFGAYRKIIIPVQDFTAEVVEYDRPNAQLTETDLQAIKKVVLANKEKYRQERIAAAAERAAEAAADGTAVVPETTNATTEDPIAEEDEEEEPKKMNAPPPTSANEGMAVVVRFSLPSGCYATSLLREFCVTVRGV